MLPVSEFRILDINSAYWGVSTDALMEQAGCAVADLVMDRYPTDGRVAVVCGSGNNGGDGFVAARHLIPYKDVDVVLVKPAQTIRTEAARRNYSLVEDNSILIDDTSLDEYSLVIDSVLGLGVSGRLREPFLSAVEAISSFVGPIVSVDCPSGMGADVAVFPDLTITFHDVKEGMGEHNCGEIVVADIGIPYEAGAFTGPGEAQLYPIPGIDSHKGQNGRVLIVGGGPYTGAPALAGLASYRTGCDLVHISTPRSSCPAVSSYSPMLLTHCLEGDILDGTHTRHIMDIVPDVDAVLIGPGLGRAEVTLEAIGDILKLIDIPVVLDADGITAYGLLDEPPTLDNLVLTPHAREMENITGEACPSDLDERAQQVVRTAASLDATILLKGTVDMISDGRRLKMNRSGNSAMTVGGTGDVLAGAVAGLMSKGLSPFDSARLASYLNGSAGEMAFLEQGYGMMATDILDRLGPSLMSALEYGRGI